MTYKDLFVAEIKSDGNILRIKDDTVYLPFGSEYSILLKNLNSRKASVNVEIDGQDVLDNNSLIIEPNSTSELEGFLKGIKATNKFRFIQKTKQIQEYRGDKVEDGLVRIEFAFEKEPWISETIKEVHHHYHNKIPFTYYGSNADWSYSESNNIARGISSDLNSSHLASSVPLSAPLQDEGITVKGQEINYDYTYTNIGDLETSQVIVIKLSGLSNNGVKTIKKPLTVKSKLTCSICGKKSKSSSKYCSNCGTYLE